MLPHLTALEAGLLLRQPLDRAPEPVNRIWFSRLWPGLEIRHKSGRLLVQLEDFRTFGNLEPNRVTHFGVSQLYLEVNSALVNVRLGRQMLRIGSQRLLGPVAFGRAFSFDGLRLRFQHAWFDVDLFGGVQDTKTLFYEDKTNTNVLVLAYFGLQATKTLRVEPYLLFRHSSTTLLPPDPQVATPIVLGPRDIASTGLRLVGKGERWSGDLEGIAQFGHRDETRHRALVVRGDLRHNFVAKAHPSLELGGTYASGGATDGPLQPPDTSYARYPPLFGFSTLFGMRNVLEGHLRLRLEGEVAGHQKLSAGIYGFLYALAHPAEQWLNAFGAPIGTPTAWGRRFIGTALDFVGTWAPTKWLLFELDYTPFFPAGGAFDRGFTLIQQSGYFMMLLNF